MDREKDYIMNCLMDELEEVFSGQPSRCSRNDHLYDGKGDYGFDHGESVETGQHRVTFRCILCDKLFATTEDCECLPVDCEE